jgi:hypothetical protein
MCIKQAQEKSDLLHRTGLWFILTLLNLFKNQENWLNYTRYFNLRYVTKTKYAIFLLVICCAFLPCSNEYNLHSIVFIIFFIKHSSCPVFLRKCS